VRVPASARRAAAVSPAPGAEDGEASSRRSCTTASGGVASRSCPTRAAASAALRPASESRRTTIGLVGSGRASTAPRPRADSSTTTATLVSAASANEVRSTEPA
jgi:hypothetical protein